MSIEVDQVWQCIETGDEYSIVAMDVCMYLDDEPHLVSNEYCVLMSGDENLAVSESRLRSEFAYIRTIGE